MTSLERMELILRRTRTSRKWSPELDDLLECLVDHTTKMNTDKLRRTMLEAERQK